MNVWSLEVVAPVSWQAGQHFFLRFPGLNKTAPYQTHPFTVANLPSPDSNHDSHLVFYFKARDGLTKKIWERLMRQPAVKGKVSKMLNVGLDGPYGSPFHPAAYGEDLMIAGGVGMTSVLPALMSLCVAARRGTRNGLVTKRVVVHWSVQSMRIFEAFESSLRPIIDHLKALGVDATLDVYCRDAASTRSNFGGADDVDAEKLPSAESSTSALPSSSSIRFTPNERPYPTSSPPLSTAQQTTPAAPKRLAYRYAVQHPC